MKIFTFDTTLRDGTQGEAVSFSVDDKLVIAQKLDDLGIDYIEGGWPGSNDRDAAFFSAVKKAKLRHAKVAAFGATAAALRFEGVSMDPRLQLEPDRSLRPEDEAVQNLAAADESTGHGAARPADLLEDSRRGLQHAKSTRSRGEITSGIERELPAHQGHAHAPRIAAAYPREDRWV